MVYSWLTTKWNVVSSILASSQQAYQWNTSGNIDASATDNFIGTVDANDLLIKTGNTEKMRVRSTKIIDIGTNAPYQKLTMQTANNNYGVIHTDGTNRASGGYTLWKKLGFLRSITVMNTCKQPGRPDLPGVT